MNKKTLISIGFIALVIGISLCVHALWNKQSSNRESVTYYCEQGILKAQYGKSYVTLSFQNGENMLLPQVVSGSGIRYELGNNIFSSKGDNAFLTVGTSTAYTNCVSGTEVLSKDLSVYTDASKTFSFSYPKQFVLSGGDVGYSHDWSVEGIHLGLLLTKVVIPKSFLPKTNFSEAKVTVGVSVDPIMIKNCLISDRSNEGDVMKVKIGDREFTRISYGDAGAGNYYETQSYRTIYKNQCYAIEYTIHSTNIYNYSPDQGIKEFDKGKIVSVLVGIVQSFQFK